MPHDSLSTLHFSYRAIGTVSILLCVLFLLVVVVDFLVVGVVLLWAV